MAKRPELPASIALLREKLKDLETQLRAHASNLERLANLVGHADGSTIGGNLTAAEMEAVSLAIVYANATLANVGSSTASIEKDRN